MSRAHEPEHERILASIVVGERDRGDGSELAGCAECSERLAEFDRLLDTLDRAGQVQRAALASAQTGDEDPHRAQIDAFFAQRARGEPENDSRTSSSMSAPQRRRWWPAVAAALLIATAWVVWRANESKPVGPIWLGPRSISIVTPIGTEVSFTEFRWKGSLTPGGWYEVYVYDGAAPRGSPPFATSDRLEEERWLPDPELTRSWKSIRWEVKARDVSARELGSSELVSASSR